jgi:hypothetical protein
MSRCRMPAWWAAASPSATPISNPTTCRQPRTPARPVAERTAVDELGDQILAPLDFSGVEHGQDVRVIQGKSHPRFLLKAASGGFVRDSGQEKLDGDRTVQARVLGAVDVAIGGSPPRWAPIQ